MKNKNYFTKCLEIGQKCIFLLFFFVVSEEYINGLAHISIYTRFKVSVVLDISEMCQNFRQQRNTHSINSIGSHLVKMKKKMSLGSLGEKQ